MDITFTCEKCGQNIVIDEAGAGITIDCPKCGGPVYVPSRPPRSADNTPVRVDASSARPAPVATPVGRVSSRLVSDRTLALKDGERVIRQERTHWAVFIFPLLTCLGVFVFMWMLITVATLPFRMFGQRAPGILFALPVFMAASIGGTALFAAWAARNKAAITLTNRRIVINKGVFVKISQELLLKQIEAVSVLHPLLGQLFHYGTIVVRGTGGGVFLLQYIENPTRFYSELQDCLARVK